jgi:adenylosuccinate synthase
VPASAPASVPTRINRVIGIAKAYTTRVGEGPMPTELLDADGEKLRTDGAEFGTTTGRPGGAAGSTRSSSRPPPGERLHRHLLTKLDILTGWERIPVCVGYEVNGVRHDPMPMSQSDFHHAVPVYEELDGWERGHQRLPLVRRPAEEHPGLRQPARGAVRRRISGIGVGPSREQSILIHDLL